MKETALYQPVKKLLVEQGYDVKGEVGVADVVGTDPDGKIVIVELKTGFSLSLIHQAISRLAITDHVYVCVPSPPGKSRGKALRQNLALCRRLGIGVITVRMRDEFVEVHCDPCPYAPRKSKKKKTRLLREFERRQGDPNEGGATRHGIVTSYRQDALRCASYLADYGQSKGSVVALDTGVPRATGVMAANHYGWFQRVDRGIYAITDQGRQGLEHWAGSLD